MNNMYTVPDYPLGGVDARLKAPFVLEAPWKLKTIFFPNYTNILFTNLRGYKILILINLFVLYAI